MLRISSVSKSYGAQTLLDNVSVIISPGERVGLVGRNGHGKSTLFRLILGEEEIDTGTIVVPKDYTIGHLSQHLHFTEPTVLDEAVLSLPLLEGGWKETYRAEETLLGLGFSLEDFTRVPSSLSGGFQIRLNLAKVLLADPNLLLLDEPTNYLDIVSVRWLTRFLKSWEKELIIITHDREFMNSVTTHTMAIHRQDIRKVEGPTEKLYGQLILEEEIYEQTRQNEEKKRKEVERFVNRFRAQATKARSVQSRVKALAKMEVKEKLSEIDTLDFSFRAAPFPGKWIVETTDVGFQYAPDAPKLIEGLTVAVGKSDRIAVIGKNGKGKTTLLNLFGREREPTEGKISIHSNASTAYFGQTNINRLNLNNTVEQEIMQVHPDHNRGVARKICGIMMFEGDTALKKISVLSGGERSRVLLGKLLVTPANLLLLDEPTNHLDMESIDSLLDAIDEFPGAVIIVTHSEMIIRSVATRLIVFDNEEVSLFEGTYDDFLERVGWSGEDDGKKPTQHGGNVGSKKDQRKQKAERTKQLAPLKKKVTDLENEIIKLEADVAKGHEQMAAVSAAGDKAKIGELSFSINQATKRISRLFHELEEASSKLQEAERE